MDQAVELTKPQEPWIGSRGRIGVVIPSTNTAVEYDCQRFMPEGVTWHFARFWVNRGFTVLPRGRLQLPSPGQHSCCFRRLIDSNLRLSASSALPWPRLHASGSAIQFADLIAGAPARSRSTLTQYVES